MSEATGVDEQEIRKQVDEVLKGERSAWGADWRSIFRDSMAEGLQSRRRVWECEARVERAHQAARLAEQEMVDATAALNLARREHEANGEFTRLAFDTFKRSFDAAAREDA